MTEEVFILPSPDEQEKSKKTKTKKEMSTERRKML